jgi:hypothetical protein
VLEADEPGIDLLATYPTTLTEGDANPESGRRWELRPEDIYTISGFLLKVGDDLAIETGRADLGIARTRDGAVAAVVLPLEEGKLKSNRAAEPEGIDNICLRMHPSRIGEFLPAGTVAQQPNKGLAPRINRVLNHKLRYHFVIPEPEQAFVDVDTDEPLRRIFAVDMKKAACEYIAVYESKTVPPTRKFDRAKAVESFDLLWEAYDRQYPMFASLPDLDWNAMREKYRPMALEADYLHEFTWVCAQMLRHLRDPRITIRTDGGFVPVSSPSRIANSNPAAYSPVMGTIRHVGTGNTHIRWGKTEDKAGFIAVHTWFVQNVERAFDEAMEHMRDTRGLVIDIRSVTMGEAKIARMIAGRFASEQTVYAHTQQRSGPQHSDLTKQLPLSVWPSGTWTYDRPVILLVGQKCEGAADHFIAMMKPFPRVTTMGDTYSLFAGAPRNKVSLPVGSTITVPLLSWFSPEGKPVQWKAVQPDIPFKSDLKALADGRDELLAAAVERLRAKPVPESPIEGPEPESMEWMKLDRPRVVSIYPPDGATDVEWQTEMRIRFDRPMDPDAMKLNWLWEAVGVNHNYGGYYECGDIRYDPESFEFVIPLELEEGTEHRVMVNQRVFFDYPPQGFRDLEGESAIPYVLSFTTKAAPPVPPGPPPRVISVEPPSGSNIEPYTDLKVRFDQPMDPRRFSNWEQWVHMDNIELRAGIKYDTERSEFVLPMSFPKDAEGPLTLQGFRGQSGKWARPVYLYYSTRGDESAEIETKEPSREEHPPELVSLLENMKKARDDLHSFSQKVVGTGQAASLRPDVMTGLGKAQAIYKLQGDSQFFAHSDTNDYHIASDGKICWRSKSGDFVICDFESVGSKKVSVGDPFGLQDRPVAEAIDAMHLEYAGTTNLNGRRCHVINGVKEGLMGGAALTWWIDADTLFPAGHGWDRGSWSTFLRVTYDRINEHHEESEFQPDFGPDVAPREPKPLSPGFPTRFLEVRDGLGGYRSFTWGQLNPKDGRNYVY